MNSCPTSAPTITSRSTKAGESANFLHSFRKSSPRRATLGEGKEPLLDPAVRHTGFHLQLCERARADCDAVSEQNEAVTDSRRIGELMDRQAHAPPAAGMRTEHCRDLSRLTQVE